MIFTYSECIDQFGSDYKIKIALKEGKLFQLDKGIYSDTRQNSEIETIVAKYPNAVFTGESAYYYHGLSDVIPDDYSLATRRGNTRISDNHIRQQFIKDEYFDMGIEKRDINGVTIRIYNQERMLVELIRLKHKYALDYYKEIISNYRNRIFEMDFSKVESYAMRFSNGENIMNAIQMEVL